VEHKDITDKFKHSTKIGYGIRHRDCPRKTDGVREDMKSFGLPKWMSRGTRMNGKSGGN